MNRPTIISLLAAAITFTSAAGLRGADPREWTLRVALRGQRIEGMPLSWSSHRVYLLGRDGHLWNFAPTEATSYEKASPNFRSYSQAEMRRRLLTQFGSRFDVSGTGHYLVVHPAGQRDKWAERFEQLHRSFVHYFTARGFRIHPPRFPLVAVVFHKRKDFVNFAAKEGSSVNRSTLGYYSPTTNRVLLYDVTGGSGDPGAWHVNAATIIHEATHQTAFNTGIHNRWADTPVWVGEGLATMFEAPGVWDSRNHRQQSDRLNRYRLDAFRKHATDKRRETSLAEFISSDTLFQRDGEAAYARAWALSFYLSETQPRKYSQFLAKTAARQPQGRYAPAERLKHFTDVFGDDLPMLDARLTRYVAGLN